MSQLRYSFTLRLHALIPYVFTIYGTPHTVVQPCSHQSHTQDTLFCCRNAFSWTLVCQTGSLYLKRQYNYGETTTIVNSKHLLCYEYTVSISRQKNHKPKNHKYLKITNRKIENLKIKKRKIQKLKKVFSWVSRMGFRTMYSYHRETFFSWSLKYWYIIDIYHTTILTLNQIIFIIDHFMLIY